MLGNSTIVNTIRLADATPVWFPAEIEVAGTLSSADDLVTGIGTAFKTEKISEGDWLVNSTNETRKVFRINSDTQLQLESAFSSPLVAATVRRLKDKSLKYLRIAFTDNDGNVRGAGQATNALWPLEHLWESPTASEYIQPQLITPGAGGASVIEGL